MTYSIVAKDKKTGAVGIAVASRFFACGAMVPFVARDVAIASQAFCNPQWGLEGRERLTLGQSSKEILNDFISRDKGQSIRQAHMIDKNGEIYSHTGADCVDWAGHCSSNLVSVAGNMLTGESVIKDTLTAYQDCINEDFLERLIISMEAGERAGGDKRGRQAAGIIIHMGQDYPWIDLRVDDHSDPLSELRRLIDVSQEKFAHFSKGMATRENFSGASDRRPIDIAIKESLEKRVLSGKASQSLAIPEE